MEILFVKIHNKFNKQSSPLLFIIILHSKLARMFYVPMKLGWVILIIGCLLQRQIFVDFVIECEAVDKEVEKAKMQIAKAKSIIDNSAKRKQEVLDKYLK